jgi:hypothetical protein
MKTRLTLQLPASAAKKLIEGYRRKDPALMKILEEFKVLKVRKRR